MSQILSFGGNGNIGSAVLSRILDSMEADVTVCSRWGWRIFWMDFRWILDCFRSSFLSCVDFGWVWSVVHSTLTATWCNGGQCWPWLDWDQVWDELGWTWVDFRDGLGWILDAIEWTWMDLIECGWVWMDLDGFDLVRMNLYGFNWIWMDLNWFGWIKIDLYGFGWIWTGMDG